MKDANVTTVNVHLGHVNVENKYEQHIIDERLILFFSFLFVLCLVF